MILLNSKIKVIMTVQTFYFFSKKVVWTAPISTLLKLIGIGTVQITLQENKTEIWAS